MPSPVPPSLTRHLRVADSPLRRLFRERLPHHNVVQKTWREELAGREPILPLGSIPPPWSVLGHGIGALATWMISPGHSDAAEVGATQLVGDGVDWWLLRQVLNVLDGPVPDDLRVAARFAWWGGLLDMACRVSVTGDSWYEPMYGSPSLADLLDQVPDEWVEDLMRLATANLDHIATLRDRSPVHVGPTFDGSDAIGGADADLIAGGSLIDVKCTKDSSLPSYSLHQIIGYALLDWTDEYSIHSVGILSVRHAHMLEWPLHDLLSTMAGGPVDLVGLRDAVRAAIQ